MKTPSIRTAKRIKAFETEHANLLIEWLTLRQNNSIYFAWRQTSSREEYAESCKHSNLLSQFEKDTDRNILLTWMKYNDDRDSYTFNYWGSTFTDLVLNRTITVTFKP